MTGTNKSSTLHSVFLASVASGAGGLAIADTVSAGSSGGLGFLVGFVGAFVCLSLLAAISEVGGARVESGSATSTEAERVSTTLQQERPIPSKRATPTIARQ